MKNSLYDLDDINSEGVIGLRKALLSFNPNIGVKFENYALIRIRGTIIDYIRKFDPVPRNIRSKNTRLKREISELNSQAGSELSVDELAKHLRLWPEEILNILNITKVDSLNITRPHNNYKNYERGAKELGLENVLEDQRDFMPESALDIEDFWRQAMRGFSIKERLILIEYYRLGMTMFEIGLDLDLSESRVSQIHTRLIERLIPNLTSCGYGYLNKSRSDNTCNAADENFSQLLDEGSSNRDGDILDLNLIFKGDQVQDSESLKGESEIRDEQIKIEDPTKIDDTLEENGDIGTLKDLEFKWI